MHSNDRRLTQGSWAPFIGLVVVAIFCGAAWFLAPKGENQT
jgi:V-type H+-transporting ATPase subunit e